MLIPVCDHGEIKVAFTSVKFFIGILSQKFYSDSLHDLSTSTPKRLVILVPKTASNYYDQPLPGITQSLPGPEVHDQPFANHLSLWRPSLPFVHGRIVMVLYQVRVGVRRKFGAPSLQ